MKPFVSKYGNNFHDTDTFIFCTKSNNVT